MPYTLEQLTQDIRSTLKAKPLAEAGEAICPFIERALNDQDFRTTHIGADKTAKREVIYEDSELGFCLCVHSFEGPAISSPHDHGPSWAIYGQAEGMTEMTDWRIIKPAQGDEPALVEAEHTYKMEVGMAHFYPPGAVHSPRREASTKLLRIEGADLTKIKRTKIKAAESA